MANSTASSLPAADALLEDDSLAAVTEKQRVGGSLPAAAPGAPAVRIAEATAIAANSAADSAEAGPGAAVLAGAATAATAATAVTSVTSVTATATATAATAATAAAARPVRTLSLRSWLPVLAVAAAVLVHLAVPSKGIYSPKHPYFLYLLLATGAIALGFALRDSIQARKVSGFRHQALFLTGVITFLNALNYLTLKTTLLPALYFPPLDKILAVIVEDSGFLLTCIGHSAKLLFTGFFFGAAAGLTTGIAVGFSKTWAYWVNPLIKALGPIPATAWIPIVLVVFPTSYSASVFMIAFAVWFPTTVMTSSGVSNVENSYFEVSSTLGASSRYQIFRVGVPAAMPSMFIGIFNGACASFIALMTAEMLGVKYGIGWYINWQKEMLAYANVYAGLILIAISFSVLITLLFKVRDRVLLWQKGVIKW